MMASSVARSERARTAQTGQPPSRIASSRRTSTRSRACGAARRSRPGRRAGPGAPLMRGRTHGRIPAMAAGSAARTAASAWLTWNPASSRSRRAIRDGPTRRVARADRVPRRSPPPRNLPHRPGADTCVPSRLVARPWRRRPAPRQARAARRSPAVRHARDGGADHRRALDGHRRPEPIGETGGDQGVPVGGVDRATTPLASVSRSQASRSIDGMTVAVDVASSVAAPVPVPRRARRAGPTIHDRGPRAAAAGRRGAGQGGVIASERASAAACPASTGSPAFGGSTNEPGSGACP